MGVVKRGSVPLAERYRDRLPIDADTPIVSLGEGGTPLLYAPRLSEELGIELYIKFDGANPTGSFKDRGMTIAVSKAVQEGARAVICASTGNTAASASAYAARAGLQAVVLVPAGAVASGKLAQSQALGARILALRGSFDDALRISAELGESGEFAVVNSGYNDYRVEGQKTVAFELLEELGRVPDVVALPYGGGGNSTAIVRGFGEAGQGLPRLLPSEAAERPTTAASAIRIADPVHAVEVQHALDLAGGNVVTLSEEALLTAWRDLAATEGIFCEPASAAGLAGLRQDPAEPGSLVVCIVTGHGLKDPEAATSRAAREPIPVEADPNAVARAAR
jgi:threonine synthase